MIQKDSACVSCLQPVTNPICPRCFSKQVLTWLKDQEISSAKKKAVARGLNKLQKNFQNTLSDTKCIFCGETEVTLCTYCFINRAERIIEREIESEKMTENFVEVFNAQIWSDV